MKNRNRALIALLTLLCTTHSATAQRYNSSTRLEDLPKLAMDTLSTAHDNAKVVIYTNGTWNFYFPKLEELVSQEVFTPHWDTTSLRVYNSVSTGSLPSTIELKLMSKMGDYHAPIKGKIFSKYGYRHGRGHTGVDVPLKVGEPIYATFSGKVRYSKYSSSGYGNMIIIRHENGLETTYAHLAKRIVAADDYVIAGSVIGFGGSTGRSTGPHLHFEVRYCDLTFDPERLIDFETGELRYSTFLLDKSFLSLSSRASEKIEDNEDLSKTLLANADGGELTSEDILANIKKAQDAEEENERIKKSAAYYKVKRGDTLIGIANKNHTTVTQICKLNGITRNTTLRIGRSLRVR